MNVTMEEVTFRTKLKLTSFDEPRSASGNVVSPGRAAGPGEGPGSASVVVSA
jgi:hypothetical protein